MDVKLQGELKPLSEEKLYATGDIIFEFEKFGEESEKTQLKGTLKWSVIAKSGQQIQIGKWGNTTLTMKLQDVEKCRTEVFRNLWLAEYEFDVFRQSRHGIARVTISIFYAVVKFSR